MSNTLPSRPNLDHLREQAKDLLASFKAGESEALNELQAYLPALAHLSPEAVAGQTIHLSDAQSAIARKHGFPSWPKLVRHVETLRALEGDWVFTSLEVDGSIFPESAYQSSHMIFAGDRFRMVSPEANYSGYFKIDVDATPKTLDFHFTKGHEEGSVSYGIFEFDGRELRICLGLTGAERPSAFLTTVGSNHALETLRRGTATEPPASSEAGSQFELTEQMLEGFDEVIPEMAPLQGHWTAVSLKRNGVVAPSQQYGSATRDMNGCQCKVSIGGRVYIEARMKLDVTQDPIALDYLFTAGANKGQLVLGIMAWEDGLLHLCYAEPGFPRPTNFEAADGSGHIASVWRAAE